MKLLRYKVTNFRSVEDSGWIESDDVTTLVGINESGKSNLLLALWKLHPVNNGEIDILHDRPVSKLSVMRKYIRSNSSNDLGIMAFIDQIDAIIFVDDARTFRHQDIRGSDEVDYTDYTDQQLLDLDLESLHEIVDFDLLDKLADLRSCDLSDTQLEILKAEYSNHNPLPIGGVRKLLSELRECNTVNIIRSQKNRRTARSHSYISGRVLDVIHSLTIQDYSYDTTDFSRDYLKNKLAVFTKDIVESDFINPDSHNQEVGMTSLYTLRFTQHNFSKIEALLWLCHFTKLRMVTSRIRMRIWKMTISNNLMI